MDKICYLDSRTLQRERQSSIPQRQDLLPQRDDLLPQKQYSLPQSQYSSNENNQHEDLECACVCYHLKKPFASELETSYPYQRNQSLSGLRNPLHIYG